jgi:hypothetical protein
MSGTRLSGSASPRRNLPIKIEQLKSPSRLNDPFLLLAGTDMGNKYRRKRAIIRLEQIDVENAYIIRELRIENSKLRAKLKRLREMADQTGKLEERFERLSSIIMESKFMAEEEDARNSESDLE